MHKMPSSEFRKVYMSLTETVEVTSNGHRIGTWTPVGVGRSQPVGEFRSVVSEPVRDHPFNSRPFTPAPRRRPPKTE